MKKAFLAFFLLAAGLAVLSAQSEDELFGGGDDDLFGGDSLIEEPEQSETPIEEILLTNEAGIDIGGYFEMSALGGASFVPSEISSTEDLDWSLDPELLLELYFDARPSTNFRIYGSVELESPFTVEEDDPATIVDETREFSDILGFNELFADFNFGETLFFRAGKQTINWGVGYFVSPADLLSLTEIDPEEPDEELEGPTSIKVNLPIGMHNLYFYTAFPDGLEDYTDVALAPKAELVIGGMELGLGAYYRYKQAPAAMMTFTTALWGIDLYGEAVVKYGSDRTFVTEDAGVYGLVTYDDQFFYQATLGGAYTWSAEESDFSFTLSGQYFFNGEGYADQSILTDPAGLAFVASSISSGDMSQSDLTQRSMHYGAGSIMLSPVEDFSFNTFWMGNFNDFSGLIKPGISWNASDFLTLRLDVPYYYGDAGDEYTPQGESVSVTLEVILASSLY